MKKNRHTKGFLSLFLSFMLIIGAASLYTFDSIVNAAGAETVVTTLAGLREALGSNGEKTVIISANITINSGGTIEIPSGAKITLKTSGSYTITATGFAYGLIQVKSGAQLIIDGTELITFTNTSGYFFDVVGTLTMNSGTITGSKGGDGGAVHISNRGSFVMNGGAIDNNTGIYGGAVHIENGGQFTMNGGIISNNKASSTGGGVHVNGEFTMNGGSISYNTAQSQGGGIYIDAKGKITINAGDFIGNIATTEYGGAIGTGTAPQTAGNSVYNAVIVGNNANKGDGRGGGIWSCPAGKVSIEDDSTVIVGNSASNRGAQVCIESSTKPTIPAKMLGGTDYEWYWDMVDQRYPGVSTKFVNGVNPQNYDSSGITLTNTTQLTADINALKAAFPTGKVFMINNTAACGGGVGGNGSISFKLDNTFVPQPTPEPTPTPGPTPDPGAGSGDNGLVLHKYLMEDASSAGSSGSGAELESDDLPYGAIPLKGITFKLYLIDLDSHNGSSPDTINFGLDDPSTPTEMFSPPEDKDNGFLLTLIGTKTTDDSGLADFAGLADGLYLVVEQPSPNMSVITPCIVPLPLYDTESADLLRTVHIYPKNVYDMPTKELVGDDSYDIGGEVSFILKTKVPQECDEAQEFIFLDVLDTALDFVEDSVTVTMFSSSGVPTIVSQPEISEAVIYDPSTWTLSIDLLQILTDGISRVEVAFRTIVNENILDGEHSTLTAENEAVLKYTNKDGIVYNQTTNKVNLHSGQIVLWKIDAGNTDKKLSGAKFKISLAPGGEDGTFLRKGADGKVLYPDESDYEMGSDWEVTTGSDGKAAFGGIKDYTGTDPKVYRTYYVFETTPPAGYNRLAGPVPMTFTEQTSTEAKGYTIEYTVLNSSGTQLPETGGIGTWLFTVTGLALIGGALITLRCIRKKRTMS